MCGIIGTFGGPQGIVEEGLQSLRERGPDELTTAFFPFAAVGVARLAIVDVRHGLQPLRSLSGQTVVAYNGEIYNHKELRRQFSGALRTGNDGEVVHALYERYGLGFADHLEGMYSVIIVDLKRRRMVLANDPLGIKPLYWARQGEAWVAASTIGAFPREYRDRIRRFPPGEVHATDGSKAVIKPNCVPQSDLLSELRRSVHSHLPDEVAWGCMLSGGLDSALVTALACERSQQPVIAYTIGVEGSADIEAACKLASLLKLKHRIIPVSRESVMAAVRRVVQATASYDLYVIPAGLATYLIAQAAAQDGLKVLLSGEGADELFAGYEHYRQIPYERLNSVLEEDQNDLGATECLRLDRSSMALGVEARVPYLAPRVVRLARQIPPQDKIRRENGRVIKKYCLREAARGILPQWAVEREKSALRHGTGLEAYLRGLAQEQIAPERFQSLVSSNGFCIQEPMDAWFHTIWQEHYGDLACSWNDMTQRGLARRSAQGRV